MIVGAIVALSICFLLLNAAADQEVPPATPPLHVEEAEPLASFIIPDEPIITVFVKGEGYLTFRESEIKKASFTKGIKHRTEAPGSY